MSFSKYSFLSILIILICLVKGKKAIDCSLAELNNCLKDFKCYLDEGTQFLKDVNKSELADVCLKFRRSKSCATPFLFFCTESRHELRIKFDKFEYACSVNSSVEGWPDFPESTNDMVNSLWKAMLAAGVTLALVFACFFSSQVSACRLTKRLKQQKKMKESVMVQTLENQEKQIKSLIKIEKQLANNQVINNNNDQLNQQNDSK